MLRVRHIETETVVVDGKEITRPKLDADGHEIEIYSIEIPPEIEAEGQAAIDTYIEEQLTAPAPTPPAVNGSAAPAAPAEE